MTYYCGKELAAAFRTVRKNTIQVAQDLPDDKYGYSSAEGTRTIRQLLVHLAVVPRMFWHAMHAPRTTDVSAFDFFATLKVLQHEESIPRTKTECIDLLTREGEAFASFLETMSEDDLAQMVTSPSPSGPVVKSRFEMLLGAKEHEMHHRGQLMLIERQLGIVPHITRGQQEMVAQLAKAQAGV
jgi:uncharacterized damage-inducible protein DinB